MTNLQSKLELPAIYPITNRRLSDLSHAAQVAQFIAGGARLIQLREKHLPAAEFYREAVAAIEIARSANVKILINDRVDIALAAKADGVHLGQNDLPVAEARKILGETAIIGFSTHTIAQAIHARELPLDYIAVGPIFATTTKENPDAVVELAGLEKVRAAVQSVPLVAIGGIAKENLVSVLNAGADSVALISALFADQNRIGENLADFFAESKTRTIT